MALSPEHKEALLEGRRKGLQQRKEALEALLNNPQFCKPSFWVYAAKTNPAVVKKVKKCVADVEKLSRLMEIRRLEKRLAKLRGE